ncbi:MAG TPA: hypothetical protein PLH15_10640 [Spirochaetota bacterium]|mgnify:CR=1 FL=1|nr:hypothetical protein [Spirochaetota bacterium]HQQ24285.1 hypothetical protein [Spirochaetota bacterium]
MLRCSVCDAEFEDSVFDEEFECEVCPECGSEDIKTIEEEEIYDDGQRCPHEKCGWEDEI